MTLAASCIRGRLNEGSMRATLCRRFVATAVRGKQSPEPWMNRKDGTDKQSAKDVEKQRFYEEILRPMPRPPPRTEGERVRLRALMIKYGKLKRKQHLELEVRQNEFLRAKWAAIDALPNFRRVQALNADPEEFPLNRPIFSHTPPIPGFDPGEISKS